MFQNTSEKKKVRKIKKNDNIKILIINSYTSSDSSILYNTRPIIYIYIIIIARSIPTPVAAIAPLVRTVEAALVKIPVVALFAVEEVFPDIILSPVAVVLSMAHPGVSRRRRRTRQRKVERTGKKRTRKSEFR